MPVEVSRNRQELGKVTKYSGARWPHFVSDVRDPRAPAAPKATKRPAMMKSLRLMLSPPFAPVVRVSDETITSRGYTAAFDNP